MRFACLSIASGCGLLLWSASALSAELAYTQRVTLSSGRTVMCAVNEIRPDVAEGANALTTTERIEAELIATARLRVNPFNRNTYPDPTSAARVSCSG